ncbi:MAG: sulfurtransferase [Chloroflexota bacterium]
MPALLISPAELRDLLQASRPRLVDTRWKLGDPAYGRATFAAGHIPGAIYLDMDRDLAGPPGGPGGRHPIPSADAFSDTMSGAGIDRDTLVVGYDAGDGIGAARLWWLLRHFGHDPDRVSVLDGGYAAWIAAGHDTAAGPAERPASRAFHARERADDVIGTEELGRQLEGGSLLLLDARAPERWRGTAEPLDPKPGRIPGAVNAPATQNLAAGHLRSAEELRAHYTELGVVDPAGVAVSCGSGVSACLDLLGLELAGLRGARLYPPSYSGWVASELPVERG